MSIPQDHGLHPFITELKFLDNHYELTGFQTDNVTCIVNANNDLYTVYNHTILQYSVHPDHSHYYTSSSMDLLPSHSNDHKLYYQSCGHNHGKLYLLYRNNLVDAYQSINRYDLSGSGLDLSFTLDWNIDISTEHSYWFESNGLILGTDETYYYHHSLSTNPSIHVSTVDGSGISLIKSMKVDDTNIFGLYTAVYLTEDQTIHTVRHDGLYYILLDQLNSNNDNPDNPDNPDDKFTITTEQNMVVPYVACLDDAHAHTVVLVYGFNYDKRNNLQICLINTDIDLDSGDLKYQVHRYYNLNKDKLYGEELNPNQQNLIVSGITNPMNKQYIYFAYVSGSDQIRVVKLYLHRLRDNNYVHYVPIVMWSTHLEAIPDYYLSENGSNHINLQTDHSGNLYIYSSNADDDKRAWILNEYKMDLGHGSNSTNPSLVPDLLETLRFELNMNINDLNDVVIKDVTINATKLTIKLYYIDLHNYPELKTDLKQHVIKTINELYENLHINTLDTAEPTQAKVEIIDENEIDIIIPYGTESRPCVVRGTEVVVRNEGEWRMQPIETLDIGDVVMNHKGISVKIVDHKISIISAQEHNSPYVIPKNYFGENRPYTDLLISGDHAILNQGKQVYPENILGLTRVPNGTTVEYHHLELENHQDNYFLANGLEVDSLHPGIYLKGK